MYVSKQFDRTPRGTISVDLDSMAHHLEGYGLDSDATRTGTAVLGLAIRRWVELLDAAGIRGTFFAVGDTLSSVGEDLRAAAEAGHEVASHSMTHRQPFADLTKEQLAEEVTRSAEVIQSVTGREVVGFRAPNFEFTQDLVEALVAAGYQYDASMFAGLIVSVRKWVCRLRGGRLVARGGRVGGFREPRSLPEGVMEYPLATSAVLGVPFYSSVLFMTGERLFTLAYKMAWRRMQYFSFLGHGIDLLDLDDGIDRRLSVHPGVLMDHDQKRRILLSAFRSIGAHFQLAPFRDHFEQTHEPAAS